jgi:low affinity Fe/Cu permease
MKNLYRSVEGRFEKLTSIAIAVLGNSITFIIAFCTVIFWLVNKEFFRQDIRTCIGEVILGLTFLSLFVIQRSFSRFSVSMHLKINELVSSHAAADNHVINLEKKTEHEINILLKEHTVIIEALEESGLESMPPEPGYE